MQPIETFNSDSEKPNEEIAQSEDSFQLELQNDKLSRRNLHSIPEETFKGTPESSQILLKDDFTQNSVSIGRIRKEIFSSSLGRSLTGNFHCFPCLKHLDHQQRP